MIRVQTSPNHPTSYNTMKHIYIYIYIDIYIYIYKNIYLYIYMYDKTITDLSKMSKHGHDIGLQIKNTLQNKTPGYYGRADLEL